MLVMGQLRCITTEYWLGTKKHCFGSLLIIVFFSIDYGLLRITGQIWVDKV